MRIANPLYDHAFKYLMSNNRLARKVLSVILDKEVLEVELAQQEHVVEDKKRQFTIYRLDFKAVIRDEAGKTETVLIELQKSKLPSNNLRFRNYLGASYSQQNVLVTSDGLELESAYPIISIYILGYNVPDIPVMATKVDRKVIDLSTKTEVEIDSDFINMLTHTVYILQARRLPAQRRTRLEQFMTLFNQAWIQEQKFILDLEEVPEEFQDIAEYLQRPLLEEDMRMKLRSERDLEMMFAVQEAQIKHLQDKYGLLFGDFTDMEHKKAELERKNEEAERKNEEAERRKEEAERKFIEAEQGRVEAEQEAKRQALTLASFMLAANVSVPQIVEQTGLSFEEITSLKR